MIQFADPKILWLLYSIPLFVLWYAWRFTRQQTVLRLSSTGALQQVRPSFRLLMRHSLIVFRIIAFSALIMAIARPQITLTKETISSEGIDLMIAFDISGSMLAKDFVPNRLEAAKKVAEDFIDGRPNDRIGVVFFAAEAYTGCPITIDHAALKNVIATVKTGMLEDGTAIGMGLGTAVNRLQESKADTKIIILVTDGENNAGVVKPMEAARFAKALNIRVYAIGILPPGSGIKESSVNDSLYATMNIPSAEGVLLQIADLTGGKYFRATNEKNLAGIYEEIDQFEKTRVDVTSFRRYEERFYLFALIAALALFAELFLSYTLFRTAP